MENILFGYGKFTFFITLLEKRNLTLTTLSIILIEKITKKHMW